MQPIYVRTLTPNYSLAAISIRNAIIGILRESRQVPLNDIRELSPNLVYEHPSIMSLASLVCSMVQEVDEVNIPYPAQDSIEQTFTVGIPGNGETLLELHRPTRGETALIAFAGRSLSIICYSSFLWRDLRLRWDTF